jgi:hypothetical protein
MGSSNLLRHFQYRQEGKRTMLHQWLIKSAGLVLLALSLAGAATPAAFAASPKQAGHTSAPLTLKFQATTLTSSAHGAPARSVGPLQHMLPASAPKPPCSSSGCYKLDPFTTYGAPASCGTITPYNTLWHTRAALLQHWNSGSTIGYIYNYYSTWCNANWAEAWLYTKGGITISIDTYFGEPDEEFQCYPGDNVCPGFYYGQTGYPTWTNMVDGTSLATACANLSIWTSQQDTCIS